MVRCRIIVGVRFGIVANIIILLVTPEVLPLVTSHDIEMMNLGKILIILCIGRNLKIALQDLVHTRTAIIPRACIPSLVGCILLTFRNIGTSCSVQTQVFETMYLIVDIGTSHERTADGMFVTACQQRKWVGHAGCTVVRSRPSWVTIELTNDWPLEIMSEVLESLLQVVSQQLLMIFRSEVIGVLSGIKIDCIIYSTCISKLGLGKHTLGIQVDVQVVVQQ